MICGRKSLLILISLALLVISSGKATVRKESEKMPKRPGYITIDARHKLDDDPKEFWSRYVNFRPGDGDMVEINPPRFSWPYIPQVIAGGDVSARQRFTLQISGSRGFKKIEIEVKNTPYNFYNTLPPLPKRGKWFWRVGYNVGKSDEKWSKVRSFVISADATSWDRSPLANPNLAKKGHPRILFNAKNWPRIKALKEKNKDARDVAAWIKRHADRILKYDWWQDFPKNDRLSPSEMKKKYKNFRAPHYAGMSHDLTLVAFAYLLFDDPKYAGFQERFLKLASWPKGGYSSPEHAGGIEDDCQTTEFLSLFYDWFYHDLKPAGREIVKNSLEWRMAHTVYDYAWRRAYGKRMSRHSLGLVCTSHQYEDIMDTCPAPLAIYEESEVARRAFDLCTNYLLGITNGFGFEEGWNEGPGYGNSKMKWLMNATMYYDTTFPEVDFSKNPYYRRIGDFFSRITPVGLEHTSFGNGGRSEGYWLGGRIANFRKLGLLTGEGRFLKNWEESRLRNMDRSRSSGGYWRAWIEYVLPYYYKRPQEELEEEYAKVFKVAGWVTASSRPPSSYKAFKDAVGMTFHARPRGGYSHSFFSEAAFDIYAKGVVITHGGGSTNNQDRFAKATMSHNTILINGRGQWQDHYKILHPRCAHITAFAKGDGFVYWAADATNAYQKSPELFRFIRHILFCKDKYFVIFDDLAATRPSTFQWLYHIFPEVAVEVEPNRAQFSYKINDVRTVVAHIANLRDLEIEDRKGLEGLVNPLTGEDYRENLRKLQRSGGGFVRRNPLFAHHIWVTNERPRKEFHFLAVIFPYKEKGPQPKISSLDDFTVAVEYGRERDVISFDKKSPHHPHIIVDYKAIRP